MERIGRMATGGGKPPAEYEAENEAMGELVDTISVSVFGLEARNDDDGETLPADDGESLQADDALESFGDLQEFADDVYGSPTY